MLKPGDIVEVRSPEEILATLDDSASIDALPYMPEMIKFSGQRFTVSHRAEKICDTVNVGSGPQARRMRDTVLLDDLRCDGSGHDGCQAGCRIYWKESWLRPVGPESPARPQDETALPRLEQLAHEATKAPRGDGDVDIYRCQATEAARASEPMSNYDLRQYSRELSTGNVRFAQVARVAVRALVGMVGRKLRLISYFPLQRGPLIERAAQQVHRSRRPDPAAAPERPKLDLQPGDWVEVRPPEEIAPTLNERGLTRGLTFDPEMIPYCGGRYQVKDRVQRLIDERNGKMLEIKSDCLILDGVVCSGEHSTGHWLCPRAIYPYWREAWLRPAQDAAAGGSDTHTESHGQH